MKNVANRRIIHNHDLAQIRLNRTQILNVSAVSHRAVLSIVSAGEIGAFEFKPVDYWVGVFLHRGCEDYEIIPFMNLEITCQYGR
jgi:hypothetical protein